MATKRIRDLTTGTPAAGDFLAVDSASGSTYKVSVDHFTPARSQRLDFNITDWNTFTTPGVYTISSGGSGGVNQPPATYLYGLLLVLKSAYSTPGLTQIYIPHADSDPGIYIRQSWDGTTSGWAGWKAIGAYYGFNINGFYIRFADGTQVCWQRVDDTDGDYYTWTYPAAFASTPVAIGQAGVIPGNEDWKGKMILAVAFSATATFYPYSATGTAAAFAGPIRWYFLAIGRWK